jgi:HK97 gp10 family phage protein
VEINLSGMEETLQRFYDLGRRSERIEDKALRDGAKILKAEMEARAPRGSGNGYHMADDIIIKKEDDGVLAVGPSKKAFYQHIIEFGSSKHSARPFAAPSFENKKDDIQREMLSAIQRELNL